MGYSNSRITWSTARLSLGWHGCELRAVAFGAEHFSIFIASTIASGSPALTSCPCLDKDRRNQARHRRQQQAGGVRCLLLRHQREQFGGPASAAPGRGAVDAAVHQPESAPGSRSVCTVTMLIDPGLSATAGRAPLGCGDEALSLDFDP